MKAIINTAVCQLLAKPTRESSVEDEALYGMVVDILEECAPGWYKVRTHYRYEGIVSAQELILDQELVSQWESLPKDIRAVSATYALGASDDDSLDHFALLHHAAGDCLLYAGNHHVTDVCITASGTTQNANAHQLLGTSVIGDLHQCLLLNH